MKIIKIAEILSGQDGAIFGGYLFRFDHQGTGCVYKLSDILSAEGKAAAPISSFTLDRCPEIVPHSNAVVFGSEYYEDGDEFPLLYSNIYNNYSKSEDRMVGVCCVYRIQRSGDAFTSTLLQLIRIGFAENGELWCSEGKADVRPYGNFVIDREKNRLFAFVMRDESKTTRYFSLPLPCVREGIYNSEKSVTECVLNEADIDFYFDTDYHNYVQGACLKDGKIYSLEGFTASEEKPPAIRVIDIETKAQESYIPCSAFGVDIEPECIDFSGDICVYSDSHGNTYKIEF